MDDGKLSLLKTAMRRASNKLRQNLWKQQENEGVMNDNYTINNRKGLFKGKDKASSKHEGSMYFLDELYYGKEKKGLGLCDQFSMTYHKANALSLKGVNLRDFDIMKVLGEGSFGKVVLLRVKKKPPQTLPDNFPQDIVDTLFAAKLMVKEGVYRHETHTTNERRILAAVKHPFILKYLFTFKDPVNLYLVTEFVPGGELFQWLQTKPNGFSEFEVRFYVAQIVMAFEYLHKLDVIYRDLKPENILVHSDGYLKLADLGFAKIMGGLPTQTFCGTLEYMAPEVFKTANSSSGYGKAVDWWSIGIFMYELHYGYAPWSPEGNNPLDFLTVLEKAKGKIHYTGVKSPSKEFKDLLVHLLQIDPSKRYGCLANETRDITTHDFFASNRLVNQGEPPFSWQRLYEKGVLAPYTPKARAEKDWWKEAKEGQNPTKHDRIRADANRYPKESDHYEKQFVDW